MSTHAIRLEEERLKNVEKIEDYGMTHERHRIFPMIFEERKHNQIIDLSAGVGLVGKRIANNYPASILCNDISPKCLKIMKRNGLKTTSFNLDIEDNERFPIEDKRFDAVISLATIEHLFHIDNFVREINRIMTDDGYLYLSAPNYNGILYLLPLICSGKTFHDPLKNESRYEFYSHIRYFTFRTLVDYLRSFGLNVETVYVPIPKESTRYKQLMAKSYLKAMFFKSLMVFISIILSARWVSEPVICFKKSDVKPSKISKRVIF